MIEISPSCSSAFSQPQCQDDVRSVRSTASQRSQRSRHSQALAWALLKWVEYGGMVEQCRNHPRYNMEPQICGV